MFKWRQATSHFQRAEITGIVQKALTEYYLKMLAMYVLG